MTADAVNVVDGLVSVNVSVAVSSARTDALFVPIVTIGGQPAAMTSNWLATACWSAPKIIANELVSLAPAASVPILNARLMA